MKKIVDLMVYLNKYLKQYDKEIESIFFANNTLTIKFKDE